MGKNSTYNVAVRLNTAQFDAAAARLGKSIINIGNTFKFTIARMASNKLQSIFSGATDVGKDFENQMARVKAVVNPTATEFNRLEKAARQMGATTKYTAQESAEALEYLARNGLKTSQAIEVLPSVMRFAGANAVGLAESANTLTNVLNMYRLRAQDAAKVSDVMSAAAANSATNVTELYDAFVNIGPTAGSLGVSVEETTAALMTLANQGTKGADAGSKLAQAFSKMLDPKVQKKLQDYGINIDSDKIKTEGLTGAIKQFANSGMEVEDLVAVFGQRSWRGIQQLITSFDDLQSNMGTIGSSAGTSLRMFEDGIGSVEKATKELQSAFQESVIKVFDAIKPAIAGVLNGLKGLVNTFGNLGGIISLTVGAALTSFVAKVRNVEAAEKNVIASTNAEAKAYQTLNNVIAGNTGTLSAEIAALEKEILQLNKTGASSTKTAQAVRVLQQAEKELAASGTISAKTQKALNNQLVKTQAAAIAAGKGLKAASGVGVVFGNAVKGIGKAIKGVVNFMGGWLGLLITAISIVLPAVIRGIQKHKDSLVDLDKVQKDANKETAEEVSKIKMLDTILHDSNNSLDVRKKALSQLKQMIPGYNAMLDEEGKLYNDNKTAIDDYTKSLVAEAKARILAAKAADLDLQIQEKEEEMAAMRAKDSGKPSVWDYFLSSQTNGQFSPEEIHKDRMEGKLEKQNKALKKLQEERQKITDDMTKTLDEVINTGGTSTGGNGGGGGGGSTTEDLRLKAIEKYNKAMENIAKREAASGYASADAEENAALATKDRISASEALVSALQGLDDMSDKDLQMIVDTVKNIETLNKSYDTYKEKVDAAKKAVEDEAKSLEDLDKAFDKAERAINKKATKNGNKDQALDWFSSDSKGLNNYQTAISRVRSEMEMYQAALDNITDEQKEMIKLGKASAKDTENYNTWCQKVEELKKVYGELNSEFAQLTMTQEISNKKFEKYTSIYDGFKGVIGNIESVGNAFVSLSEKIDSGEASIFDYMNTLFTLMDGFISTIQTVKTVTEAINNLTTAQNTAAVVTEILKGKNEQEAVSELLKGTAAATAAGEQAAASASTIAEKTAEGTVVTAVNTAEAATGAAASMASIPWVGPALAIAAVATILGVLAALPKFASGGLVGSKLHGDNNLARVNGNEMILNGAQQRNLMNLINHGGAGGGNGEVELKIRGKDLVGVINNYNKSNAKITSTL